MFTDKQKIGTLAILTFLFFAYSFLLYKSPPPNSQELSPAAQRGKSIWQTKNCSACHQIYGLGGHLGPDLTNIMSKKPSGYVDGFLINGTNIMPNFHLSEAEINDLKSFLTEVDQTGISDPKTFKKHPNGTLSK